MSLIMNATKAAQREKDQRAGDQRDVPILVPLRAKPQATLGWGRLAAYAGAGAVVLTGVLVLTVLKTDSVPRALRTPGPSTTTIVTRPETKAQAPATQKAAGSPPPTQSRPPAEVTQHPVARRTTAAARRAKAEATQQNVGTLRIDVADARLVTASRYFADAVEAHKRGDLASARTAYGRVLAITPGDVGALNNFGVLLLSVREFEQAEAVLRRGIVVDQTNAGLWNNLGLALRERGRSAEAIAAFQRALAVDPSHAGARVSLAQQFLVIGSLSQARQMLDPVLAANPEHAEANYCLGQVLERQGDKAGAIRAYETFVRSAPPGLSAYVEGVRQRLEALNRSP